MSKYNTLVFCLVLIIFSCKRERVEDDKFSSTQNLFVEFVSAYTNGYVSSQAEIKVKLAKSVESAEPGEEIALELFRFEPGLKGTAFWEDNRTAVFKPAGKLKSGQHYKAIFLLGSILETSEDKEEFKFTFSYTFFD